MRDTQTSTCVQFPRGVCAEQQGPEMNCAGGVRNKPETRLSCATHRARAVENLKLEKN